VHGRCVCMAACVGCPLPPTPFDIFHNEWFQRHPLSQRKTLDLITFLSSALTPHASKKALNNVVLNLLGISRPKDTKNNTNLQVVLIIIIKGCRVMMVLHSRNSHKNDRKSYEVYDPTSLQ
jgi:hypothetical protein